MRLLRCLTADWKRALDTALKASRAEWGLAGFFARGPPVVGRGGVGMGNFLKIRGTAAAALDSMQGGSFRRLLQEGVFINH